MKILRHPGVLFFAAAPVALAPTAWSQTTDASTASGRGIEEIIVTANKRAESIDTVPMSIKAASGEQLKELNVNNVQDLASTVPGLTATTASFGTDVYTIRGVGFYDTTLAAIPAVSVYVDEVPLPFAVMTGAASLDPERVEVLMGPQGTLFGQNSTGGAINYVSAKPTDVLQAGVSATIGTYMQSDTQGYLSGPLGDTLGARLSFKSQGADGWQRSISRDDNHGAIHRQEGRLILDWRAHEQATFLLNVSGFSDRSDTQAPRNVGYALNIPDLAFAVPEVTGAPVTQGPAENADWDDNVDFDKHNDFHQVSLRSDFDLGDRWTLTNIAAYAHYGHDQQQDGDGLSFTNINYQILGSVRNLFDELRLSGHLTDSMQFVVGASYQDSDVDQHQYGYIDIYTTSFAPVYASDGQLPRFHDFEDLSFQRIRSHALFGNVDYHIDHRLALHIGARFTDTAIRNRACTLGDEALTAIAQSTNPPGECVTLSLDGVSGFVDESLEENNVSWRIGADYTIGGNTLLYGNISRGYKAGGYPVLPASTALQFEPAVQEELTAYEVGFKATLNERTLRMSGAVFYYDYRNKQIRGRVNVEIFGTLERLVNIPDSEVMGAELSLEWQPVAGLDVGVGVSRIESEIQGFSNYDIRGNVIDLDGTSFPNAPDLQYNANVRYDRPLGNGSRVAFLGADYSYSSSTYGTLGTLPEMFLPSYGLLGLRAGLHDADDRWRIWLWGRNVTDEFYLTGANRAGEALIAYAGMPATFGLSFSLRYE